jgi:formylglycine-generating enzyme required for sulfatase activity
MLQIAGKLRGGVNDNYAVDRPVGTFPPNPLGLYDMAGGRPEWTNDWLVGFDDTPLVNPRYDTIYIYIYDKKTIRGWHTLSNSVYIRGSREPDNSGSGVGFRCVCNQKTAVN